jgi:drug/metabolite transporter (DMT)-like permease
MVILALAVLSSAAIPLLFRAFADWRISVLWAVPANYLVCVILGSLLSGFWSDILSLRSASWVYVSLLQGGVLAGNFYLLAFTAQRAGVSMAALGSRLAVAIPVLLAFFLYGDSLSLAKTAGLAGAFVSLYLCSIGGPVASAAHPATSRFLLAVVFVSFGLYFSLLKFAQAFYLEESSHHAYVTASFFFAFCVSVIVVARKALLGSSDFRFVHLLGGVVLGGVNYTAVYFLVRVLSLDGWESSQIFPTYSVGALMVSSLLAMIIFSERLSRTKWVGLAVGIVAVALLNR